MGNLQDSCCSITAIQNKLKSLFENSLTVPIEPSYVNPSDSSMHIQISKELEQNLILRQLEIGYRGTSNPMGKKEKPTRAKEDIFNIYQCRKLPLGSGHFGTVKRAQLKNSPVPRDFAIKTVERKGQARADVDVFLRELEYLKYFDHPNIVRFHEVYEDENNYHLVLEY